MDEKTAGTQPPIRPADDISPPSSRNIDETYTVYKQHLAEDDSQTHVDEDESNRVLRKVDWHLLPLLMGSYFLQYIDKSSINFASVYGLQEDLGLHDQQYAWLSSIFYFGYMIAQYPAGYAMQRLPTGKFIGVCTIGEQSISQLFLRVLFTWNGLLLGVYDLQAS